MAVFSKLITTENGRTLIARMLSGGEKVVFTKVCSSDREYGVEELGSLTELAEIRQTSSVSKVSRTNDISVKVEAVFTNTELTEGYYMRTVALYARGGEGEEVLYAAAVETSGNCFMPAFGGITVSGAYIQLVTTVSNTENVTLEVDNSVFATIGNIMELQEQIDGMSELLENVASAVNANAKKLEALDQIGSYVYSNNDLSFSKKIPYGDRTELIRVPLSSVIGSFGEYTYFLYTLENKSGTLLQVHHENDYKKILEGFLWVNVAIGQYFGAAQAIPIAPSCSGNTEDIIYMGSLNLMTISGRPSSNDIVVSIWPFVYERVDGKLKKLEGNLDVGGSLYFRAFKLGTVLANISGGGTVPSVPSGGTNNYNLLANKPSINNITLQGNLTSKQLGLEGGSSGTVGMTYEEALEILNEAGEEVTKV